MRTIHKYAVPHDNTITVLQMPRDTKILHGDLQGEMQVWAEVETDNPVEDRQVIFVGTGREVPHGARHVNTCLVFNGGLVFHLYEICGGVKATEQRQEPSHG